MLESLANAGPALTRALSFLPTFPFPKETLTNWIRGDYANLTLIIDLTLSRIDQGVFTGTRWECDLTWLELQWGRTIGQLPSPCTASAPPNGLGNPLLVPYRWDQGHDMRMTRRIVIQLLIFSLLAVVALGIMIFGYMRLPALLGIGQYRVIVELPEAAGLYAAMSYAAPKSAR